ncbi:MAG TPA: hypothetical protein VFD52_08755 [Clostridia bacterium]|nr:hypothetical protein [Clostridia bacterium]
MQTLNTFRLIADEGKRLTNGQESGYVIDLAPNQSPRDWHEIDDIIEEEGQEEHHEQEQH